MVEWQLLGPRYQGKENTISNHLIPDASVKPKQEVQIGCVTYMPRGSVLPVRSEPPGPQMLLSRRGIPRLSLSPTNSEFFTCWREPSSSGNVPPLHRHTDRLRLLYNKDDMLLCFHNKENNTFQIKIQIRYNYRLRTQSSVNEQVNIGWAVTGPEKTSLWWIYYCTVRGQASFPLHGSWISINNCLIYLSNFGVCMC